MAFFPSDSKIMTTQYPKGSKGSKVLHKNQTPELTKVAGHMARDIKRQIASNKLHLRLYWIIHEIY